MRFLVSAALLLAACVSLPRGGAAPGNATPRGEPAWLGSVQVPAGEEPLAGTERERVATAIEDLDSKDFGIRSAAARELVEFGERAIPYLGSFGDSREEEDDLEGVRGTATVVLEPILAALGSESAQGAMDSPYAVVRAAAASSVGERHLTELAPLLIRLLDDPALRVRRAAIAALRRISNRYYGYRPEDSPSERAAAVARWRELWGAG